LGSIGSLVGPATGAAGGAAAASGAPKTRLGKNQTSSIANGTAL
jgi:hypothetical protein